MKNLLFTHKIDIDGMGSVVLANLVFDDTQTVFCDTFEIDALLDNYISSGKISEYDKVFVTDLCPSISMLKTIENNQILKDKVLVFDHHITDLEKNNFAFVTIEIENENGKCCGTSLFYEFLKNNFDFQPTLAIDEFVELTRKYDTWEWKTKFNEKTPNDLNILFSATGREKYILLMTNKFKLSQNFKFSDDELKIIDEKKSEILEACKHLKTKMEIVSFENLKTGIVHDTDGKYRNEFAEYLKSEDVDIDLMIMFNHSRETASFRAIKPNVDVGQICSKFGGKGHKASGGCPFSDKLFKAVKLIQK